VTMRTLDGVPSGEEFTGVERELTFLGLAGMIDPPRPEVKAAVVTCRRAGIRPVMITGDHRITAEAIATNLDICRPGDRILTGEDLEGMTADELQPLVPEVSVYARVTPEHKMKIVGALKRRGEIVG